MLTVDPTFCLGDFDVTPITYRHLLLETRRGGQTPVFLGPILVHYRKTFSSYLFFTSSLIGQNRQLEGVRVIGIDGEQPLIDALLHEFGFAQHLTCFIHVRRNVKDKLSECTIPHDLTVAILQDIFGQRLGSVFQEAWWIPVTLKTSTKNWSILYSPGGIWICQAQQILISLSIDS